MDVGVYARVDILMTATLVCCLSVQCLEEDTAISDQHLSALAVALRAVFRFLLMRMQEDERFAP